MATVSKRSVIRFGKDGLVVSLPRAWTDYYRITPGSKVEVVAGTKLTIRPVREAGAN